MRFSLLGSVIVCILLGGCGRIDLAEEPASISTQPPPEIAVFQDCPECPEMVRIPGQSFAAGRYEVTFAEWDACVADGGCDGYRPNDEGWGRGRRPVINVSWNDAQAYTQWLSGRTGQQYRLLTSAEWGVAALAGSTSRYSWGGELPVCDESARNGANFSGCADDRTRPVGSFPPNALGLHDVDGNIKEWTDSCVDRACAELVIRGGCWNCWRYSGAANTFNGEPNGRGPRTGFRLGKSI
jgi:formylglycine-generating enzyme required for sulfatase activity